MNIHRYLFPTQNLKKISADNYLAITKKKKLQLEGLLKKINSGLHKHTQLIEKLRKDALIAPEELKLFEKSNKSRTALYQLILQLQYKVFSNPILSHPRFPSRSKTAKLLTQTEINNYLDVINTLSLSIEISEILHGMLYNKDYMQQQSNLPTKIDQLAMKVHFLPNNSNDFLTTINTELMHLAVACASLSICFFLFAAISHGALVAAAVFLCTGLHFFGISVSIHFMNQKTEIVSLLINIVDHFKFQDLKFDYDSIFYQILNAWANDPTIDISDALAYELGSHSQSDSKIVDLLSQSRRLAASDEDGEHSIGPYYHSLSSLTNSPSAGSGSEEWSESEDDEEDVLSSRQSVKSSNNRPNASPHEKVYETMTTPSPIPAGKKSDQPKSGEGLQPLFPGSSLLVSTVISQENSDEDEWIKVEAGSKSSHTLRPVTTV